MKTHWIAIDWGSTHFRAFLLLKNKVAATLHQPCGMLTLKIKAFPDMLERLLQPWLVEFGALPVVMAGMVGSQQGWQEVPYARLPCDSSTLAAGAMPLVTPWGSPAWIIPGVSGTSQYQQPDVMRGEETQLLGLAVLHPAAHHTVLLPGTHSKHATMINDKIVSFSTFMSGELFSLLSQHSILGRALPAQQDDEQAFLFGVDTAQPGVPFSHLIFSARTHRLSGEIAPSAIESYLSGLVIGYELNALATGQSAGQSAGLQVWVVGNPSLIQRYQQAAAHRNLTLSPVDGDDCFVQGLGRLYSLLQGVTP